MIINSIPDYVKDAFNNGDDSYADYPRLYAFERVAGENATGYDCVVYDLTDLNGTTIDTSDDFYKYCDENGYDEESFEVYREALLDAY